MAEHKSAFVNDLVTPTGTVMYLHVDEPDSNGQYADGKYKIRLLIPKTSGVDVLKAGILKCIAEAWPGKGLTLADIMLPFRDGDLKEDVSHAGCLYINPKSKRPPMLVDARKQRLPAAELYAGCQCRLVVTAMSYVQAGKPGITFLLEVVQKLADGERITGAGAGDPLAALGDDVAAPADDMSSLLG